MLEEKLERLPDEEAIVNAVKNKRVELYKIKNKRTEIHDKIVDFADYLKNKYSDVRKCYLFHVMIGSTVDRADCHIFDFSGEDSVEKFIEDLLEQERQ